MYYVLCMNVHYQISSRLHIPCSFPFVLYEYEYYDYERGKKETKTSEEIRHAHSFFCLPVKFE